MTVESTEPLGPEADIPTWMEKPLWQEKLRLWAMLIEKGCLAKRGRGGTFCGWAGHACFYNGCPRRIFEEVAAAGQPVPPPAYEKQLTEMTGKMSEMEKRLGAAMEEIEELKNELKKED